MKKRSVRFIGMVLGGVVLLSGIFGCSSGSDGPPPDADPTGYYINDGTADVMQADNMTQLLLTDLEGMAANGQLMMVSANGDVAYVGTFSVSVNSLSGTLTLYENNIATQSNVAISGTITEGSTITGTMMGTGAANGTFTLNYALPADNGPVDISMLLHSSDWTAINGAANTTPDVVFTTDTPTPNFSSSGPIATSGQLTGCNFSGRVDPIAGTHLYSASATFNSCMDPDVELESYTGLISKRGSDPTDLVILVLTNGSYGLYGVFERD